jgi:hypothetical protein
MARGIPLGMAAHACRKCQECAPGADPGADLGETARPFRSGPASTGRVRRPLSTRPALAAEGCSRQWCGGSCSCCTHKRPRAARKLNSHKSCALVAFSSERQGAAALPSPPGTRELPLSRWHALRWWAGRPESKQEGPLTPFGGRNPSGAFSLLAAGRFLTCSGKGPFNHRVARREVKGRNHSSPPPPFRKGGGRRGGSFQRSSAPRSLDTRRSRLRLTLTAHVMIDRQSAPRRSRIGNK